MQPLVPDALETLKRDFARAISNYASDPANGTDHLRAAARAAVDAREHIFTKDGTPDWAGRTFPYREWVREAYVAVNADLSGVPGVQNAVRYHVGNRLRERLTATELEALGLRQLTPRERSAETRAQRSAKLNAIGAGGPMTSFEEVDAAFEAVLVTLERMKQTHRALSDDDYRAALFRLEMIEKAAAVRRLAWRKDRPATV